MKTRYKILTIIIVSIAGFLIVPFYATNIYCDIFEPTNGGCMRIVGIGLIDYTSLPYLVIDSRNTGNPNECWVKEDDGNMVPCKIDTGPILWPPSPPKELGFDEKTVKVEGKMADEICAVVGGECPPFYPGNLQDDGSIMVGFVISDQEKIKHYQFFIKNDTLSYVDTMKENEN